MIETINKLVRSSRQMLHEIGRESTLARTLIFLDELDEALALADEILENEPGFIQAWLLRAYIFGQTGREADSHDAIHEVRRLAPNLRTVHLPGLLLIADAPARQRFLDGIRKAGLPA